jgi:putative tryptophan/tyrosine transport system substrate-binding protein
MRRREIISLLGSAAMWPYGVRAQRTMPVVGFLSPGAAEQYPLSRSAFLNGLAETGYVEGQNVAVEYRWAEYQYDRLSVLAGELVRHQATVIVTGGSTPTALAAKAATQTIPIVFVLGSDPVLFGLVNSLARPGGNVTGVTILTVELVAKALELLHELVPAVTMIGVLVNPDNVTTESQRTAAQIAAENLGVHLLILNARSQSEIETEFAKLVGQRAGALLVTDEALFSSVARDQLVALTARHAVPTLYQYPPFVAAGGLMGYGANLADAFRLAGVYAGRVLRGERPADLPVQQSTKVELNINLKTAKALGLSIPQSLLARADEVVE